MISKGFLRLCWATLVVIYFVIIAGSVVRMTGSGMGCPDWPKCFGYLVPPTEESQVVFQPNSVYFKGQMIIYGNELLSANHEFTSSDVFDLNNWTVYEKHDYAIFNSAHTWTEYINRLVGAVSGLFMFFVFLWSCFLFVRKRSSYWLPLLSFIGVILLGFQAWLGKTVVDSNLQAGKITAHMFGAMALIAVVLLIIRISSDRLVTLHPTVKRFALVSTLLLLIQVYFGTGFRVYVDAASGHQSSVGQFFPEIFKTFAFKLHRSFAWIVLASFIALFFQVFKVNKWSMVFTSMVVFLAVELILGVSMSYLQFPFLSQPMHLLSSMILFGNLCWVLLSQSKA